MNTYEHRFYIGPHSPFSVPLGRIIKRNTKQLHEIRTECPPSGRHREILGKLLKLSEAELTDWNTHQIYVDSILDQDSTREVIYNYDAFLGSRKNALKGDAIYPSMEKKVGPLRLLTKAHKATVFLCLQSYTDLIELELRGVPKLRRKLASNPENLQFSWLPFVSRLCAAWPEAKIVIFQADNLAVHWAANVALMTGHPKAHLFKGINDFPLSCIDEFGRQPLKDALDTSPVKSIGDWLKTISHFFSQYGFQEPELDTEDDGVWTLEQIQYSKKRFTADIAELRKHNQVILANDLIVDFK